MNYLNMLDINYWSYHLQLFSPIQLVFYSFFVMVSFAMQKLLVLGQVSHFSNSVMSDSLQPHGLQHARLPCPSPTPGDYSNSCPSSWWCHLAILSSVVPFSSCLQSFPASGAFPIGSSLHQVAKVLEFQLQHQSFQWIFRTDFL